MPPSRAAGLSFEPQLPAHLRRSLAAWQPGWVVKVFLSYGTPFWREWGRSGTVMWHDPPGLYACDASRSPAAPGIVLFVGGPLARQWVEGGGSLRDRAVAALVDALGEEAAAPVDVTIRNWIDDDWSGGAYNDIVLDMDARDAEDRLRAGHGDIVFASSELSLSFPGYIEGAIIAGRAAAATVISSFGGGQSRSATSASGS